MLAVDTWETRATVAVDLGQITVLCHGVLAGDAAVLTTLQPAPKEPHEIWEKLHCVLCHGSATQEPKVAVVVLAVGKVQVTFMA